jgi:hypothetical protein
MLRLKHIFVLSGFKSHMINESSGGGFSPPVDRSKQKEAKFTPLFYTIILV